MGESKKEVLLLSYHNPSIDPRVLRQLESLKSSCHVTAFAPNAKSAKASRSFEWKPEIGSWPTKALQLFDALGIGSGSSLVRTSYTQQGLQALSSLSFDLIIANDVETLPLASHLKKNGCKVIFDAHEWYPNQWPQGFARKLKQRWNSRVIELCALQIDRITTVSEKIAGLYRKWLNKEVSVITNAAPFHNLSPQETKTPIRMVHSGGANPDRQIELMIDLVSRLEGRFSLDLYLVPGQNDYYQLLLKRAQSTQGVQILPPVPRDQLIPTLNQYDIGLYILIPTSINQECALPNKLFEYTQARLAIAAGPAPQLVDFIQQHELGIGFTTKNLDQIAQSLLKMPVGNIDQWKANAHAQAQSLSSEVQEAKFREVVNQILL